MDHLTSEEIACRFAECGDFYICKDTATSCFIEFFFLDKKRLADATLESFNDLVMAGEEFGVLKAVLHKDAPRFKSDTLFRQD